MCGGPYHAAEGYLSRLIQKGHRVEICEKMEEAGAGKKLVRREITRVVTPGTATESSLLRSHENNYLASVFRNGTRAGLAHVDISTGEFRVTEVATSDIAAALENLSAREGGRAGRGAPRPAGGARSARRGGAGPESAG